MQIQLKKQHSRYSKYKHTGIPWLGDVPERWEVRKIKTLSQIKRGASPRPIDDPKYFDDNGEYAWVRISDVTASNDYLENTTQRLSALGKSLSVPLQPGMLFLSIAGSVGKPMITKIKCCIHDGFVYFQNLKYSKRLLFYIFFAGEAYKGLGKLGTQLNLNTETVGSIYIPVPSEEDQIKIVDYLVEKSSLIDRIIEAKQKQIELLKEKRSALINRAVTKGIRTKVMFDTNAFDQWQKLSKKAQDQLLERVEIIYTHIQEDELPSDLRDILPSAKKVSTSGAIYDVSRYDNCTYGGEEDGSNISAVVGSGKKENHSKDALIANTAKMQNYLLITDDQRLQKKCSEISGEAIPFKEFIARFNMKDSGVEWIGEVPKNWETKKLKYVCLLKYGSSLPSETRAEGDVEVFGSNGVVGTHTTSNTKAPTIIVGRKGSFGAVNFSKKHVFAIDTSYFIDSTCGSGNLRWLYYELSTLELNKGSLDTGVPGLSREYAYNKFVPYPPKLEQAIIADYLDEKTVEVDAAISKIKQSIVLLQEYKTSLVSSVVTGKVKVTYEN